MNYRHGFFQLINKSDGVYIKIYPPMEGGNSITIEDIISYLEMKKITDYNKKEVSDAISTLEKVVIKLNSSKILPEDEYLKVTISEDKKLAIGRFYPPTPNGKFMTKQEILSQLEYNGVKYGVSEKMVERYLKGRQFCINIVLAKATVPREGKSAEITYCFNTSIDSKPKINEDGSVDFHQLDNINHVNKGDILATMSPVDYGDTGMDVCGNILSPVKVSNKTFKHGKNIYISEDGLKLCSDVSGHVSLTDDTVFVSNIYDVPADVSAATGNIKYDGNVNVNGNVVTGFIIEATGDIYVKGVVEGATLIAGGDIVLNRGIQGMSRGILEAKGNIISKFIENCTVTAGGYINTDAIMHSKINAKGDIIANGKRGLVTGGEICSSSMISLKTAGSTMGTYTLLEVGLDPALIEEYRDIEKEIPLLEEKKEDMLKIVNRFTKKLQQGEKLSQEKIIIFKNAKEQQVFIENKLKQLLERSDNLEQIMENSNSGKIIIQNIAYPGVKIVISNVTYYVKSEIHHGRLVKDGADIRVTGV